MKRWLLLALVSCAWSPNPQHQYRIVYADGYQVASQQGIATAVETSVNDWMADTNNYITFTFDDVPNLATITIKGYTREELCNEQSGCPIGITFFDGESSTIHLPYDLNDPDKLRRITEHEMGHSEGLLHTGDNTIMHWNLNGASPNITCADVAQLCIVWNNNNNLGTCDPTDMPVCQNETAPLPPPQTTACNVFNGQAHLNIQCNETDPYTVQLGATTFASCLSDLCEVGQTCFVDTVQGICVNYAVSQ